MNPMNAPLRTLRLALPVLLLLGAGLARADAPTPLQQFETERGAVERGLAELGNTLEGDLVKDDVKAAEALYGLERRAISVLVFAANHRLASEGMSHDETVGGLRAMLQRVLRYQERVKDYAQDKLDKVLPGEPGRKLISVRSADAYKPLFRAATPVPGQAPKTEADGLRAMEQDFVAQGGDLKRDIRLLGKRYLKSLGSGELAEWTQVAKEQFSITSKGAKHPVILSEGKKRLGAGKSASRLAAGGAGSAKVWTDSKGEIVLAIASNSSGNLKPGTATVEPFVNKLISSGIKEERILTTSIVPEEPELVKLLLKARKNMTKEQIAQHVADLKTRTAPKLVVAVKAPKRKG